MTLVALAAANATVSLGQSVANPQAASGAASSDAVSSQVAPAIPLDQGVRFGIEVRAVLTKAGCNQGLCHGNLNGKGGFRLSLRGEDPAFDHDALCREQFGRRVNPRDPAGSLLLTKATGAVPHQVGARFEVGSPAYNTLRDWIAAGAKADDPTTTPLLTRLVANPATVMLCEPLRKAQLTVTAHFSDGQIQDVTATANYDTSHQGFAVSADGEVTAPGPGETTVLVRYLDGMAMVAVTVLPPRADFVWNGPDPATEASAIDRHVMTKLMTLGINASPPASETVWLRRVYLDLLGRLPTVAEQQSYYGDDRPHRRERRIDALLEQPEFADVWALKWADVLRADALMLDPIGAGVFHRWLVRQVAADRPINELASELLTARGSTYLNPPAAFGRINRTPQEAAETTAQLFLGVRLRCASCHNHPTERWTQDDLYGLAAFFARVSRKNHAPQDALDNVSAVRGEETITLAETGEVTHPRTGRRLTPRVPGDPTRGLAARTFAPPPKTRVGQPVYDPRRDLADWLTEPSNPYFARAVVNRVWYHLMGRGIVEPVDDFRDSNPPVNPQLLDALAEAFATEDQYRLRNLVRRIVTSRTYGLSSRPTADNAGPVAELAEANFARAVPRVLSAEVLLDALCDVTGVGEHFADQAVGTRAVQIVGGRTNHGFLKAFGKPARLTVCECERSSEATLSQSFELIAGPLLATKLAKPDNTIGQLLKTAPTADATTSLIETLYLMALTRPPTTEEVSAAQAHIRRSPHVRSGLEDLLWALLNSKEFLLRP